MNVLQPGGLASYVRLFFAIKFLPECGHCRCYGIWYASFEPATMYILVGFWFHAFLSFFLFCHCPYTNGTRFPESRMPCFDAFPISYGALVILAACCHGDRCSGWSPNFLFVGVQSWTALGAVHDIYG